VSVLPRGRLLAAVEELLEELERWVVFAQAAVADTTLREHLLHERVERARRLAALGADVHHRDTDASVEPSARITELAAKVAELTEVAHGLSQDLLHSIRDLDVAAEQVAIAHRHTNRELIRERERSRSANVRVDRARRSVSVAQSVVESLGSPLVRGGSRKRHESAAANSLALAEDELTNAEEALAEIKRVLRKLGTRNVALEEITVRVRDAGTAAREEHAALADGLHSLGLATDYLAASKAANHRAAVGLTREHEAVRMMQHRSWAAESSRSAAAQHSKRAGEVYELSQRSGVDVVSAARQLLGDVARRGPEEER
jgi:hypothetical protein